MPPHEVALLEAKLEALKKSVDDRWASHDRRSDERWTDLMENFHELKKEIQDRPCISHVKVLTETATKTLHNEKAIEGIIAKLWAVMLAVITAIIVAIASLFRHN